MSVVAPGSVEADRERAVDRRGSWLGWGCVLCVLAAVGARGELGAQTRTGEAGAEVPVDVESAPRPVAPATLTTARLAIDGVPDE
ncbi:MAG: hypothetical protein P8170_24560, partial [Gemmatimonadota bacterium]